MVVAFLVVPRIVPHAYHLLAEAGIGLAACAYGAIVAPSRSTLVFGGIFAVLIAGMIWLRL